MEAIREAMNYGPQASNADATKLAHVKLEMIFHEQWETNSKPIILLSVHDELVAECDKEDRRKS